MRNCWEMRVAHSERSRRLGMRLEVGEQEIQGTEFAFAGGEIHLTGASDQVVDVRLRFFQRLDVAFGSLFADEEIRVGFFVADRRKRENADFEIVFEKRVSERSVAAWPAVSGS